ncbi:MAG: pyridoxamine 5'-phosphate oxidase family protein [Bdellovibrio sp.]|nr:pyridoxamine 5'-phosphate oxidase family protein [Bdellovibrio sp.]
MKSELETEIRSFFPTPHKATAYLATVDRTNGFTPEIRPMTLMELNWHFYVATTAQTRKAHEMAAHPKVSALIMFKNEAFLGYLRIVGSAQPVADQIERKEITDAVAYNLNCHWKGADDPNLAFLRIIPERIEYMRPGDDEAKDVSAVLLTAMGGQ